MDQIAEYQLHSDIEDVELCDSAIISLGESLPLFSSVKRLNLSGNQIHSFKTVIEILSCFSSLQILLLNSNPLKPSHLPSFTSSLTTLAVSHTSLHVNDLIPLLSCLPNLQFLSLSSNSFGDVPILPFSHSSLQTLDLSSNQISSWDQIATLGSIESLQTLFFELKPAGRLDSIMHVSLDSFSPYLLHRSFFTRAIAENHQILPPTPRIGDAW